MNLPIHRNTDLRTCGAQTTVIGQGTVYVNGLLISVEGDTNTHGEGKLHASLNPGTIYVNGKKVVLKGSSADPDLLCPVIGPPHCNPVASGASGNVFAGGAGNGGGGLTGSSDETISDPSGDDLYPDPNSQSSASASEEEAAVRAANAAADPSAGGEITPAPGDVTDREQQAYNYFISQGYTPEQAAGIVGNLVNESALDPTAVNPNDAGLGRDSEGIAQWNRDRLTNLQGYAAAQGTDYRDFNTQLSFVDHELRGTGDYGGGSESTAYNNLQNASTASDAAVAFSTYERYRGYELGIQGGETQQRAADAGRILTNNS